MLALAGTTIKPIRFKWWILHSLPKSNDLCINTIFCCDILEVWFVLQFGAQDLALGPSVKG